MNADRLLALYEKVADAPDAVPRLRRFVLDLAVRGKLVPQDAADEPASELLKRIAAEKARLVKAGEIKRPKPVGPVAAGEMAFPNPPGWAWTRLAEIAVCLDYMRKPINGTERDMRIEGKSEDELFPYYGATQQQGWIDDYIFDEELVLLGEDGVPFFDPYRSKAYIISGKTWVNNHAHVFKGILISHPFLAQYLNVFDYTGRVVGATRSKLNQARAVDIPVPLPPLAEQRRIVGSVEELMALLDRLEAARTAREATRDRLTAASLARLTASDPGPDADPEAEPGKVGTGLPSGSATTKDSFPANARFALATLPALTTRPDQIKPLRQTILNLAVRGKLVEQDPTDEPASELLGKLHSEASQKKRSARTLPAKHTAEMPFECPPGWAWAQVRQILARDRDISYGVIKLGPEPKSGGVPTLRCSDVRPGFIDLSGVRKVQESIEADYARTRLKGGEVVINIRGTLGGVALVPDDLKGHNVAREVAVIPIAADLSGPFLVYLMLSPYFWDHIQNNLRGIAYKGLNLGILRELPIPLPPLAEQHRIVAKVDALMALCDGLEAALTTTDTTRARLLEALLHEALAPAAEAVTEAAE